MLSRNAHFLDDRNVLYIVYCLIQQIHNGQIRRHFCCVFNKIIYLFSHGNAFIPRGTLILRYNLCNGIAPCPVVSMSCALINFYKRKMSQTNFFCISCHMLFDALLREILEKCKLSKMDE